MKERYSGVIMQQMGKDYLSQESLTCETVRATVVASMQDKRLEA